MTGQGAPSLQWVGCLGDEPIASRSVPIGSWRAKGRKRKPAQSIPTIIEGVKSPAEIKRDKRIPRLRELTEG